MKSATRTIHQTVAAIVTLLVFMGSVSTVGAGEVKRFVRSRHTEQTQVVIIDTGSNNAPRPVADENPINPQHFKNTAPDNSTPSSDSNRAPVKRTTVRRW